MRGIAFEVATFQSSLDSHNLKQVSFSCNNNNNNEPISVLDTRSPSPSTSTSTPSSSMGGGSGGCTTTTPPMLGVSGNPSHQKWPELQPIPPELELLQQRFGVGLEDFESLLSESAQDQSLRWISGDFDDSSLSLQQLLQCNQIDQNAPPATLSENSQNPNLLPPLPPQVQFYHHNLQKSPVSDLGHRKDSILNPGFEKVPILNPGFQKDSILNPGFQKDLILNPGLQKVSILNQGQELLLKKPSPVVVVKQEPPQSSVPPSHHHHHHHQYQVICDQLFAAAELMLSGNRSHAQGILARLNHQFASGPTPSKPFQRAAFYFKEAMQMQLQSNLNPNRITPHFNGMFKMGAYKMFSEVSPVIQFMNFTSNQTLLEALGDAKNIHIIDFDIGFGAQWASFIQELPITNNGSDGGGYSLKITAFASPSTHHPLELGLMHENLSQLAQEIGISFELEVVNFDSFDPRWFSVSENEKIAVNFPIWSACTRLSAIPSILHFVKQLSPRIVVSFDRGCERTDLPFPRYLLQGLQYYEVLLDSIDGVNVVSDTSNKIERYLFQSQIERMVSGKLQFPEPMPHWKSLFAAGGYVPVGFSNFAETQAECVLKRMQVQGFRLEKRQASLVLCWQNRELMTASAWKC
ncbi:putative transcription factor GRAS family [Helianthus annuus]|nr:putative transcription factor GRAS family [Helianthus annuus]KAJ0940578.1 putative transcription factor GRAS family [Helianthus annuus]KAJ0952347.1 putative transcription factor GRAS family [Helianthus annuus]